MTYIMSCSRGDSRAKFRKGFTLVEILVTLSLLVLITAALVEFYQMYSTLFTSERILFTIGTSANIAITEIEKATLEARQILTSRVVSGTTYTTGASTLVLELPSTDASGVISNTFDYVVFYISGDTLYRLIDAHPSSERESGTKELTDWVSALALSYDTADASQASMVTVDLTLKMQSGHLSPQTHLQQQIYLRNK